MFFASICGRVLPHGSHVCVETSGSCKERLTLAPSKRRKPPAEFGFSRGRVSLLSESSQSGQSESCPAGGFGEGRPRLLSPPRGRWKGSQTSLEPPPVLVRLGAAGTGGPGWSWQWWTVEAPGGRCQECGRTASPWRLGRRQLLPMQRRDGQVWGSQSRGWNKWADASAPSWTCAFSLCASVVLLPPFPCPGLEGRDVQGRRDTLVVWFLQCPGLADGTRAQAQLPWQGLGGLWCFTGAQGAVGWAHPGPSSQGCGASFGHGHFASVKCRPIKLHYLF